MDNIYKMFHSHYPVLTEQDLGHLSEKSTIRNLSKKEIWLNGEYHYRVAFIAEGALRAYFLDEGGKEITSILKTTGQTIVTPGAVVKENRKVYYTQAIVDTTIIEIPLPALLGLCRQNERLFQFFLLNIIDHLHALMERVENLISLKPDERLRYLLRENKALFDTIPHKYLANYIGITPVSFSRLLKKFSGD